MDFQKHRKADGRSDGPDPITMAGVLLKIVTFIVLLAIGLKLTFWAVGIVDELLHHPDQIAILAPLMQQNAEGVRSFQIESTGRGFAIQDHNALSLLLLVLLVAVLFGAVGRAIAAIIGGAIKLVTSIDFRASKADNQQPPPLPDEPRPARKR